MYSEVVLKRTLSPANSNICSDSRQAFSFISMHLGQFNFQFFKPVAVQGKEVDEHQPDRRSNGRDKKEDYIDAENGGVRLDGQISVFDVGENAQDRGRHDGAEAVRGFGEKGVDAVEHALPSRTVFDFVFIDGQRLQNRAQHVGPTEECGPNQTGPDYEFHTRNDDQKKGDEAADGFQDAEGEKQGQALYAFL